MLKSQANAIFDILRGLEFEPTDFVWETRDSIQTPGLKVSSLVHKPTGYYYVFDFHENKHWTMHSPGSDQLVEQQYPGSWDYQQKYVRTWLENLKQEVEAPNLWGALSQETKLVEAASATNTDNTPFTTEEQQYISQQLQEIETYLITTQALNDEQAEFVRRRLNYLDGAAKRSGRVDWVNTMVGVIFSIIISAAFAPEQARELFRFVTTAFRGLLNQLPALP